MYSGIYIKRNFWIQEGPEGKNILSPDSTCSTTVGMVNMMNKKGK